MIQFAGVGGSNVPLQSVQAAYGDVCEGRSGGNQSGRHCGNAEAPGEPDPLIQGKPGDNPQRPGVELVEIPARQHQTPEQATWNLIFQRLDAFNLRFGRSKPVEVVG